MRSESVIDASEKGEPKEEGESMDEQTEDVVEPDHAKQRDEEARGQLGGNRTRRERRNEESRARKKDPHPVGSSLLDQLEHLRELKRGRVVDLQCGMKR